MTDSANFDKHKQRAVPFPNRSRETADERLRTTIASCLDSGEASFLKKSPEVGVLSGGGKRVLNCATDDAFGAMER